MSIDVISLSSNNDGTTATATCAGTLNGSPVFTASRTPDFTITHVLSYTGSGPYDLTFPAPVGWYVTAADLDGTSPAYPVWIGQSYLNNISGFQSKLQEVLLVNGPLIMASLSDWYPNVTLKTVAVNAFAITQWPAIVIDSPRWRTQYKFFPYGLEHAMSCNIFCALKYSDEDVGILQASQMGMTVASILNSPAYETLTLDNGLIINFGYCSMGEVGVSKLTESTGWLMVARIAWSGLALTQEAPGL